MSEAFGAVQAINDRIEQLEKENAAAINGEELAKLQSSDMDSFQRLQLESQIEIKRQLRLDQINQLKKQRDELIQNMDNYILNLKKLAPSMHQKRMDKVRTLFKNSVKNISQFDEQYAYLSWSLTNGQPNSTVRIKAFVETEPGWNQYDTVYQGNWTHYLYRMPIEDYFKRYVWDKWDFKKRAYWNPPNDDKNFEAPITKKSAPLLKYFRNLNESWMPIDNLSALVHVIRRTYPSVFDYVGNEVSYPNFIDFAENVPWPNADQIDMAVKKWIGIGTKEFAENNIPILKQYAEYNTKQDALIDHTIALPQIRDNTSAYLATKVENTPETTYGIPKKNPHFNFNQWAKYQYFNPNNPNLNPSLVQDSDIEELVSVAKTREPGLDQEKIISTSFLPAGFDAFNKVREKYNGGLQTYPYVASLNSSHPGYRIPFINWPATAKPHVSKDTAKNWYWPRPKQGYVLVPGFDYINPAQWTGAYIQKTPTQFQLEQNRRKWLEKFKPVNNFIETMTKTVGEFQKYMNFAIQWNIASGMGVFFGPAAGISGIGTTVLENTGLSDSDLGKILVKVGQAVTIANITNKAVQEVVEQTIQQELINIAKREVGSQTGLDQTAFGRVTLDLTAGTAFNMLQDQNFIDALKSAANKSWRVEAAKQSPYAAILIAGLTEIEKNGLPDFNNLDPDKWFENINWDSAKSNIKDMVKSIKGKDITKLIAVAIAVDKGYITREQAALMVGQEVATRQIERFYEDEPIYGPKDPATEDYEKMMAEKGRWDQAIAVTKKLASGVPPTKQDILVITDNVAGPIYDKIKGLGLPMKTEIKLWDVAINKVGLPNMTSWVPDLNVKIPEWAKSKESQVSWPVVSKEKIEEKIGKDLTKEAELTKDDIAEIILSLLPRNTPLVPMKKEPELGFNFIDDFGKINVRTALKFPYDHPMLKYRLMDKRYTKTQEQYILERNVEMQSARNQLAELEKQIAELNAQNEQLG